MWEGPLIPKSNFKNKQNFELLSNDFCTENSHVNVHTNVHSSQSAQKVFPSCWKELFAYKTYTFYIQDSNF